MASKKQHDHEERIRFARRAQRIASPIVFTPGRGRRVTLEHVQELEATVKELAKTVMFLFHRLAVADGELPGQTPFTVVERPDPGVRGN